MKQKTILIITLILFVLGMLILMSSCSDCDEWKVISRYKEIERRQEIIIANQDTAKLYPVVNVYIHHPDSLYNIIDSLRREIIINRQYQNAMINSMFVLGKGITNADSNNRMGYYALKENQLILKGQLDYIQTAIDSQRLRCWLDCQNNFIVTDSTNCNEVLEILNNLNQ